MNHLPEPEHPPDSEPNQTDEKGNGSTALGASGIAIGLAVGVGIGVALDNIGLGIGIGLAVGVAMSGAFVTSKSRKDKQQD